MDALISRIVKVPLPQRLAVMALLLIVIAAGTFFFVIQPLDEKIARHNVRISQLDNELEQKKSIARNLVRYRVEVERLKQRLNEALTLLPNEAEIPELLQKLASLVQQSDLVMRQFEPTGEVVQGFYAKIPVKMSITGNYHSIAIFFDKVAKLARIVNVTDIKLRNPKVENKRIVLEAEFVATTFKFVEAKPVAAGTTPGGIKPQIQ